MNFWDQQFSVEGFKYGTRPNEFLRAQAPRLQPGARVLLPGDGEGRNSVWLAGLGHRVLAVDLSEVGLRKARTLAEARGVRIETEQADLADWEPRQGDFDAAVLTYLHLPPALRTSVHQRLAGALRPGGLLILDAVRPDLPEFIGCVPTLGSTRGVAAFDGRVYLAEGCNGLRVVDVADPYAPALLRTCPLAGCSQAVTAGEPGVFVATGAAGIAAIPAASAAR